jgi:eukaryotic-like serine/threonine-protein kinase
MPPSDVNTMSSPSGQDTEIIKMVLDLGLATPDEVDACREQQKQSSDPNSRSIADYLVESQHITPNQAKRLRQQAEQRKSSLIPGYEIQTKLGSGAMAVVWKARQIKLNRTVAIKVLKKKYQSATSDTDYVDRFYKEGQAAAKLSHNNIVQAIDVGSTQKGEHYFVMEYVEGKSLYDVMAPPPAGEGRNFSEAEALDIGIQIGEALAHAHSRGLLHRDVKPKNIILTPQGVAKLTDLGLARDADDVEAAKKEAGRAYGTPYYISPEQIRGELDIDFRTDIYSLGATLYHMVTGRPPFEGDSPTVVMHKHLSEPLVPADHVNTALSAGLGEIIDVAMAKRREERYASTQAMVEDLKAVRDNKPPSHGRRAIDLDSLARVEETGKTVDIVPVGGAVAVDIWKSPVAIALAITAGASILCNLIMLAVLLARK